MMTCTMYMYVYLPLLQNVPVLLSLHESSQSDSCKHTCTHTEHKFTCIYSIYVTSLSSPSSFYPPSLPPSLTLSYAVCTLHWGGQWLDRCPELSDHIETSQWNISSREAEKSWDSEQLQSQRKKRESYVAFCASVLYIVIDNVGLPVDLLTALYPGSNLLTTSQTFEKLPLDQLIYYVQGKTKHLNLIATCTTQHNFP